MLLYRIETLNEKPANCLDCPCHWCRLPLMKNRIEPMVKKEYRTKRHKNCPLIEQQ